jgi:SLT domain-containing protein
MTIVFGLVSAANACDSRTSSWCGKKHSASYNKKVIEKVAKARGYGPTKIKQLKWIAYRESRYRNTATNGPCKGMFQLATRQAKSKWANPYWNTNRAITYIEKRYGSPARAISHIKRRGWY